MSVTLDRKVRKIDERNATVIPGNLPQRGIPPNRLRHLHIEEMWSMQRLVPIE